MEKPSADRGPTRWHSLSAENTLERLHAPADGLSHAEASKRLAQDGPNRLPEAVRRSGFIRFLQQFQHILIYVLIGSAAITAMLGHWIDTGVILAVVVANAVIGFIQEGKAEKAMDAIRHMLCSPLFVLD